MPTAVRAPMSTPGIRYPNALPPTSTLATRPSFAKARIWVRSMLGRSGWVSITRAGWRVRQGHVHEHGVRP